MPELLPGTYRFSVHLPWGSESNYLDTVVSPTITSGNTTSVIATLTPAGKVETIMTDAKTGALVANACLIMVDEARTTTQLYPYGVGVPCSGADGHVVVRMLRPGTYKAFVRARDGVHGAQWVAPGHGVGQWEKARTITVTSGATTTLPPVMLDKKGSVSGTITDEVTGAPIPRASVTFVAFTTDRSGGEAQNVYYTDGQGRYSIPDLGPYQWSFYYTRNDYGQFYAGEWTGDEAYRDRAGKVKVKVGQNTVVDNQLGYGTTISGHIVTSDGAVVDSVIVWVYDATTGELIADSEVGPGRGTDSYVAQIKGERRVKFLLNLYDRNVWVGGTDLATATEYRIPDSGSMVLDLPVS